MALSNAVVARISAIEILTIVRYSARLHVGKKLMSQIHA